VQNKKLAPKRNFGKKNILAHITYGGVAGGVTPPGGQIRALKRFWYFGAEFFSENSKYTFFT